MLWGYLAISFFFRFTNVTKQFVLSFMHLLSNVLIIYYVFIIWKFLSGICFGESLFEVSIVVLVFVALWLVASIIRSFMDGLTILFFPDFSAFFSVCFFLLSLSLSLFVIWDLLLIGGVCWRGNVLKEARGWRTYLLACWRFS